MQIEKTMLMKYNNFLLYRKLKNHFSLTYLCDDFLFNFFSKSMCVKLSTTHIILSFNKNEEHYYMYNNSMKPGFVVILNCNKERSINVQWNGLSEAFVNIACYVWTPI